MNRVRNDDLIFLSVLVLSRLRRCSCSIIESIDAVLDDPFDYEHRFAEYEHVALSKRNDAVS